MIPLRELRIRHYTLASLLLVTALLVLPLQQADPARIDGFAPCRLANSASPLGVLEQCALGAQKDAELLEALGARYEENHQSLRAEDAYTRALVLDPGHAELHWRLGRLMLARGAPEEASHQARLGLAVQPNRAALVTLLREAEGHAPDP